jgi:hypothetical protein
MASIPTATRITGRRKQFNDTFRSCWLCLEYWGTLHVNSIRQAILDRDNDGLPNNPEATRAIIATF